MLFSEIVKREASTIIDGIYGDEFIQGMIQGDIPEEAIKHYLRADARYLFEFAKIYALLIPKVDSKEEIEFLTEQIAFAASGEVEAHHILADYVKVPYNEIIKEGEWYPSADHYIKHMYFNAYHYDDVAYTIAAMAPCPYVYQQIAQRALREVDFGANHPLKAWFEFYAEGMDELMEHIDTWLNACADHASDAEREQLKRNFLESTKHERNFFNMSYHQETWDFGG